MATSTERLFTAHEIADQLRVSPRTVARWIRDGYLRALRARRVVRISESALREFLDGDLS